MNKVNFSRFISNFERFKAKENFNNPKSIRLVLNDKSILKHLDNKLTIEQVMHEKLEKPDLNSEDIKQSYDLLLYSALTFETSENISALFELWEHIMTTDSLHILHPHLLSQRKSLLYIIMNTKNFLYYEIYIKPIMDKFSIEPIWDDKVVTTMKAQKEDNELTFDYPSIINLIKGNTITLARKRLLILKFVQIVFIHRSTTQEKMLCIEKFFEFVKVIGDNHCLFRGEEFNDLSKALRLIAMPPGNFEGHLKYLKSFFNEEETQYFGNFLTSAMHSIRNISPETALKYWKFKLNYSRLDNTFLNHHDLKIALTAFSTLNLNSRAIETYNAFPLLHNDDQISVLLKIVSKNEDWGSLQKYFEMMYGRTGLPNTSHYSIVMNKLASKGKIEEVDALYIQYKQRKLTPNESILNALIDSRIYHNKLDEAVDIYKDFLSLPGLESISAPILTILIKAHLTQNDINGALAILNEAVENQKLVNYSIVEVEQIIKIIKYAAQNFLPHLIPQMHSLAKLLNLDNKKLLSSLIKAYTNLSQYDLASGLVIELHKLSEKPFSDAHVYALQYKNLFEWWKSLRTSPKKSLIFQRMVYIEWLIFGSDKITESHKALLIFEISRYYLWKKSYTIVLELFNEYNTRDSLIEHYYIPLFRAYSQNPDYDLCMNILDLYDNMVSKGVKLTIKSSVYLMKARLYLDGHNGTEVDKHAKSYEFLRALLERYGISFKGEASKIKPQAFEISKDATSICSIVTEYARAVDGDVSFFTEVINQLRNVMGVKVSGDLKSLFLLNLVKVLMINGYTNVAEGIIDQGLKITSARIDEYKKLSCFETFSLPPQLRNEYLNLVEVKLTCLSEEDQVLSRRNGFLELMEQLQRHGLTLAAKPLNTIFIYLLKNWPLTYLESIISICEENLVKGNRHDALVGRKYQYFYKLVILDTARFKHPDYIKKFEILNEFYGVTSVESLEREFKNVDVPKRIGLLVQQKIDHERTRNWTSKRIFGDIAGFFNPERTQPNIARISTRVCELLYKSIKDLYNTNNAQAFDLMSKYPDTIDYVLQSPEIAIRKMIFRKRLDELYESPELTTDENRILRTYTHLVESMHEGSFAFEGRQTVPGKAKSRAYKFGDDKLNSFNNIDSHERGESN